MSLPSANWFMRGAHVWQVIVRRNKAEFDAHPKMYVLVRRLDGAVENAEQGGVR